MRFIEIKSALRHLVKTTKCLSCQKPYIADEINVVVTTKNEGLFELHCHTCHLSSIMTVTMAPEVEVKKSSLKSALNEIRPDQVTPNDILDVKNFLNNFDGDFKKLFPNEK